MSSEMSNVIMKYSIPSLSSVEQNDRNFCFDCVYILISWASHLNQEMHSFPSL